MTTPVILDPLTAATARDEWDKDYDAEQERQEQDRRSTAFLEARLRERGQARTDMAWAA